MLGVQVSNGIMEQQVDAVAGKAMTRNLLCHIYPRRCGKWRRTVAHLLARWPQFTGKRVVTIAVDGCCDDPEDVIEAFGGAGEEVSFIVKDNVPELQEVASFTPMMERVIHEPGITLYCHAKGATHERDDAASHKWCDAMAAACLDYSELVDCCFKSGANIAGAFRSHGLWSFPGYHNWHFAGTWWWVKNARAAELDWRNVHPNFMGVEAWPGIFPLAESACLFYDNANTAHLYNNEFWRENIAPAMKYWHKSLQSCGILPLSKNSVAVLDPAMA